MTIRFSLILWILWLTMLCSQASPISFSSAEATFHRGSREEFLRVIDGVVSGPLGWSPAPRVFEAQSMIVCCKEPIVAEELTVELYFLCGKPLNAMAQFALSFTQDDVPRFDGRWEKMPIDQFAADVGSLQRAENESMKLAFFGASVTGNQRDDVYRLKVRLPTGRATGFRLDAIPVELPDVKTRTLSWWPPHDFTLTEFRVEVRSPEITNIALNRPVLASHELHRDKLNHEVQLAGNLTDGSPATIAHRDDAFLGEAFFFEIDLQKMVEIDHISLRNRADECFDRMRRLHIECHEHSQPTTEKPLWQAWHRMDDSDPEPGAVDVIWAKDGQGSFRGRYLKISSTSDVVYSPQLAEVEVYEKRTPALVGISLDGNATAHSPKITVPPDVRRLAIQLAIDQRGMPRGDILRWRLLGMSEEWQSSSLLQWDLPCPRAGKYMLEVQARHSDGVWDSSILQVPMRVEQHFWQNPIWQLSICGILLTTGTVISRRIARSKTARLMLEANARASLAEERARIARDLHDDLGSNFAEIAMMSELAQESLPQEHPARKPLTSIYDRAESNTRRLGEIVWAVNPANDTIEHFIQYLCNFAQNYLASANIRSRFDVPQVTPPVSFTAAKRYHLLLACKEAIHNAVRHGKPQAIYITVRFTPKQITLTIRDDGHGCNINTARNSLRGCANMRLRMDAIHGSFSMDSQLRQGTTVIFQVPFDYEP